MGRHTRGGPESPDQLIAAHTGQLRQIAQGGAAGWPVLQEIPHRLDLFAKTRGDGRSIEAQPSRLIAFAKELDQRCFFIAWIGLGEQQYIEAAEARSEERRVGKGCGGTSRSRVSPEH